MARKLRIAVSVFFGLLTVALCVLWVRSNWWSDNVLLVTRYQKTFVWSADNFLFFELNRYVTENPTLFEIETKPVSDAISVLTYEKASINVDWQNRAVLVWLPHWLSTIGAATLAASLWLPIRRFSLRTLLIAITLGAIVLGLGVWQAR